MFVRCLGTYECVPEAGWGVNGSKFQRGSKDHKLKRYVGRCADESGDNDGVERGEGGGGTRDCQWPCFLRVGR